MKGKALHAIGRRKEAVARAFLKPGKGEVVINGKNLQTYFGRESDRIKVLRPLVVTSTNESFDVMINVRGGGPSGQTTASQLAIARALVRSNPELKPPLRKEGLVTVDSRVVERKKYGRRKARRGTQFSKR